MSELNRSDKQIVWDELDSEHGVIQHHLRKNWEAGDSCMYCKAGFCIQDYQTCDAWDGAVVVHGFGSEEYGYGST